MQLCVIMSMRRLSYRSASTPPYHAQQQDGPNCSAVVRPSATPLSSEICSTSQSWPMRCIQVPVWLTRFAEA